MCQTGLLFCPTKRTLLPVAYRSKKLDIVDPCVWFINPHFVFQSIIWQMNSPFLVASASRIFVRPPATARHISQPRGSWISEPRRRKARCCGTNAGSEQSRAPPEEHPKRMQNICRTQKGRFFWVCVVACVYIYIGLYRQYNIYIYIILYIYIYIYVYIWLYMYICACI